MSVAVEGVTVGMEIEGLLAACAAVVLAVAVAVALWRQLELPLWVTLVFVSPLVVGSVATAKAVSLVAPVSFVEAVLALGVALFFLAGGYGIVERSPG